jgi:hypothetical protein
MGCKLWRKLCIPTSFLIPALFFAFVNICCIVLAGYAVKVVHFRTNILLAPVYIQPTQKINSQVRSEATALTDSLVLQGSESPNADGYNLFNSKWSTLFIDGAHSTDTGVYIKALICVLYKSKGATLQKARSFLDFKFDSRNIIDRSGKRTGDTIVFK